MIQDDESPVVDSTPAALADSETPQVTRSAMSVDSNEDGDKKKRKRPKKKKKKKKPKGLLDTTTEPPPAVVASASIEDASEDEEMFDDDEKESNVTSRNVKAEATEPAASVSPALDTTSDPTPAAKAESPIVVVATTDVLASQEIAVSAADAPESLVLDITPDPTPAVPEATPEVATDVLASKDIEDGYSQYLRPEVSRVSDFPAEGSTVVVGPTLGPRPALDGTTAAEAEVGDENDQHQNLQPVISKEVRDENEQHQKSQPAISKGSDLPDEASSAIDTVVGTAPAPAPAPVEAVAVAAGEGEGENDDDELEKGEPFFGSSIVSEDSMDDFDMKDGKKKRNRKKKKKKKGGRDDAPTALEEPESAAFTLLRASDPVAASMSTVVASAHDDIRVGGEKVNKGRGPDVVGSTLIAPTPLPAALAGTASKEEESSMAPAPALLPATDSSTKEPSAVADNDGDAAHPVSAAPAPAVAFASGGFQCFGLPSLPVTSSEDSKEEEGSVASMGFKCVGIPSPRRSMLSHAGAAETDKGKHGKRLSFSQQAALLLNSNLPFVVAAADAAAANDGFMQRGECNRGEHCMNHQEEEKEGEEEKSADEGEAAVSISTTTTAVVGRLRARLQVPRQNPGACVYVPTSSRYLSLVWEWRSRPSTSIVLKLLPQRLQMTLREMALGAVDDWFANADPTGGGLMFPNPARHIELCKKTTTEHGESLEYKYKREDAIITYLPRRLQLPPSPRKKIQAPTEKREEQPPPPPPPPLYLQPPPEPKPKLPKTIYISLKPSKAEQHPMAEEAKNNNNAVEDWSVWEVLAKYNAKEREEHPRGKFSV